MRARTYTFREAIEAAAKSIPELWKSDEALNLTALARLYKRKGHPVSQATLHRLYQGKHRRPDPETIDATYFVLGIPRAILRGEALSAEMDKLLTDYKLSTLLLAQKLESLPKTAYDSIVTQVNDILEREERLRHALQGQGVASIDKRRG